MLWGAAPRPVQIAATFVLILFGWVLFRAPDMAAAMQHAGTMLGLTGGGPEAAALAVRPLHLIVGSIGALVLWFAPTTQRILRDPHPAFALALQLPFLLALVHLHYEDHVPFLYFQF